MAIWKFPIWKGSKAALQHGENDAGKSCPLKSRDGLCSPAQVGRSPKVPVIQLDRVRQGLGLDHKTSTSSCRDISSVPTQRTRIATESPTPFTARSRCSSKH